MNVKDITLKRLILCVDGHAPIIFRRLKGYPKSELIPCETFYKENKQNVSIPEKFSTNNMQNDDPKDNRQKYISKGRLQNQVDNNDTRYECYLIENAILGYYYTQLCSEQGSLASHEQQKEFKKRKFEEQDFERLQNPFSYYFIFNKNWYNQKTGASSIEDDGILWGDMSGAEYFTLYFDDIKFDYPHQATVKAHIDYGVRVVNKVYAMHHWNDIWWIDDIALPQEPIRMLSDWVIKGDPSDKQVVKVEKSAPARTEEETIYNIAFVDEQPEFPGGMQAMYNWIAENIQYPEAAFAEGIQGKVIVEVVVDQSGNVKNPRVIRGRHPQLDKEALRVVNAMPAWKPARVKGAPVSTSYTFPVSYKIDNADSK